jgi:hypothetical protein
MAEDSTRLHFSHWLQWVGDRTPGRRGSGVQMGGEPVLIPVRCSEEELLAGGLTAAHELWTAETRFLEWARQTYPSHSIVHWEVRIADSEGVKLSEFRSGFTISE